MTIEIVEASAGTNFAFRAGQKVSSEDCESPEFQSAWDEILKEQVRCGHAIEITGAKIERAINKAAIEKR